MISDEIKAGSVLELIKEDKRIDGRGLDEYRKISLVKNVVGTAEGSARVKIGKSEVLAGVKIDPIKPYADRPKEGTLVVDAEFLAMAHETFEPGQPSEDAIELMRIVDRGIRSAEAIDVKSLFIEEEKAWGIYVDLYVLNHDGNLRDVSGLAAVSALTKMYLPQYKGAGEEVGRERKETMSLTVQPTYCTFAKIGGKILVDPTYVEELAADAVLTLSVGDDVLYATEKSGVGAFTKAEIMDMFDRSVKHRKTLISHLE